MAPRTLDRFGFTTVRAARAFKYKKWAKLAEQEANEFPEVKYLLKHAAVTLKVIASTLELKGKEP